MANADVPRGLVPVRYLSGAPYNGAVNHYSTATGDNVAIFIGDPVILSGTSSTINGQVYADVDQAATTDVMVGVVVGVMPATSDSLMHRAASTARILLVADDPNLLFEIQEVSGGTPLAIADIGLNAAFVVGTGNATTGLSGVELNNSGEGTGNTLDLKIVGFQNRPDNEVGEHAKWLVRINRHQYVDLKAGI